MGEWVSGWVSGGVGEWVSRFLGEIKFVKIVQNTGICLCFSRVEIFMN